MKAQLEVYDQRYDEYVFEFEVTPGVIDYDAIEAFTEGHCASLAYAIHQETGWDMMLFTYRGAPRQYGHAMHMAVLHPSGDIIDIEGRDSRRVYRERWYAHITKTTPDAFLRACDEGLWVPYPEEEITPTFVYPLLKEVA